MLIALTGVFAGGAWAGISATKHNLSNGGPGTIKGDGTEICIFCHTPHDAIKTANIPLWNKQLSALNISYGVYTSPTLNATDVTDVKMITAADATVTNLCLSCHDGTVAINSFNNPSNLETVPVMVGTTAGKLPVGNSNLGTDLTNDHPVNFTYDQTLADADKFLTAPASLVGVKLFSNKVQCASCHDPHLSTNGAFLRVSMSGSALCLSCHTK
ncbi:MAG: cytochrome c3 family protein [Sulfurimicrobium sp.]|nr:cytochrome c3 family protein [Sulfurimicrobium sp.]MDP3686794.1 cytochrome c3 family protein [Sulfurimicrobium sp.]